MRILVIEDNKKMADFIKRGLKENKYAVDVANDGDNGLYLAEINQYDLIVLDVMLPEKDGLSVCRELRKKNIDVPVILLTARNKIEDKITGLDTGADDYLTKPFVFAEFLARVRALIRRKHNVKTTKLQVSDLELDQLTHRVTRAGEEIQLTATEYSLLEYLMLNANQIVTRTMISEHIWDDDFDSLSNIINVYIGYLRKKIDEKFETKLIHSVRGAGYILRG